MGTHPIFESDFDCLTDMEVVWTHASPLPAELEGFSAATYGVVIFGGVTNEGVDQNQVYHYSPKNDTWRQLNSSIMAPEPRSNCGLFATEKDGKKILYVFGGLNAEQGWMSSIWKGEIDVQSVHWEEVKHSGTEFTARDKFCVVPDDQKQCCYLVGGFGPIDAAESDEDDETEPSDIREHRQAQEAQQFGWFDEVVKFDASGETLDLWVTKGTEGAAGKACAAGFKQNDQVLIFGGRSMSGRTNEMFTLDLEARRWDEEKPGGFPPSPRSWMSYAALHKSLFVFGGQGRNDELLGGLHRFSAGKWSSIESTDARISPRRQAQLVSFDKQLLLLGGLDKVDQQTGINNILREVWIGKVQARGQNTSASDPMTELGLKRKSN